MKTVICTGDSHTWGQGASSVIEYFTQPTVFSGELRPVPFGFGCYVNLLRNYINTASDSTACEYEPHTVVDREYTIDSHAELARLYFRLDGVNRYAVESVFAADGVIETPLAFISAGERVTVRAKQPVYLYRVELYSGEYAVINSGVGSCSTERFLSDFYRSYVERFKPYMIIAEAHSINDWLAKLNPTEVTANLCKILTGCGNINRVLVTVPPIGGRTALPFNERDYSEYIEASRTAAIETDSLLADVNAVYADAMKAGSVGLSDNWHPDDNGHRLYADVILNRIKGLV